MCVPKCDVGGEEETGVEGDAGGLLVLAEAGCSCAFAFVGLGDGDRSRAAVTAGAAAVTAAAAGDEGVSVAGAAFTSSTEPRARVPWD